MQKNICSEFGSRMDKFIGFHAFSLWSHDKYVKLILISIISLLDCHGVFFITLALTGLSKFEISLHSALLEPLLSKQGHECFLREVEMAGACPIRFTTLIHNSDMDDSGLVGDLEAGSTFGTVPCYVLPGWHVWEHGWKVLVAPSDDPVGTVRAGHTAQWSGRGI